MVDYPLYLIEVRLDNGARWDGYFAGYPELCQVLSTIRRDLEDTLAQTGCPDKRASLRGAYGQFIELVDRFGCPDIPVCEGVTMDPCLLLGTSVGEIRAKGFNMTLTRGFCFDFKETSGWRERQQLRNDQEDSRRFALETH